MHANKFFLHFEFDSVTLVTFASLNAELMFLLKEQVKELKILLNSSMFTYKLIIYPSLNGTLNIPFCKMYYLRSKL